MKTKFSLLVALSLAASAFGAGLTSEQVSQAGFDKLTEAQKAKILSEVANQVEAEKTAKLQAPDKDTAEKLDAWVNMGEKIGKGLTGAAKEAGVAVNEFAKTPVGILATALIVWKMVGSTIYHLLAGLVIWAVGFPVVQFMWRRAHTKIVYDKDGNVARSERETIDGESFAAYIIGNLIIFGAGLACIVTA